MSINRLNALASMNKHLNVLLQETPHPSKEWETLNNIITQLDDLFYWVAVSVEGTDTKKRHMAFYSPDDQAAAEYHQQQQEHEQEDCV